MGVDPNPIKHVGSMMKTIRERIEPSLLSAGFVFGGRNKPIDRFGEPREPHWLDYRRAGMLFSFRYEPRTARLVAEIVDDQDRNRTITAIDLDRPTSTAELMARIDAFVVAVTDFLATLPAASRRPNMT